MKTAKIGAIFLAAIMAFTAIGAAYAHWEQTIYVYGVMETDNIDVYFNEDCLYSNDPETAIYTGLFKDIADKHGCGEWILGDTGWYWDGIVRKEGTFAKIPSFPSIGRMVMDMI